MSHLTAGGRAPAVRCAFQETDTAPQYGANADVVEDMMQQRTAKRLLALVAGLVITTATSAYAQDSSRTGGATTDTIAPSAGALDTSRVDTTAIRDTTDTSGVQNPPGYQGMERDTTLVPRVRRRTRRPPGAATNRGWTPRAPPRVILPT